MWSKRLAWIFLAAWTAAIVTSAGAQGIIPPKVSSGSGNVFVWMDGAYYSAKLPVFGLGFFNLSGTFDDLGAAQTHKPRVNGESVSGGFGLFLPHGTLPGANARVTLVGGFIQANAIQQGLVRSEFNLAQLLDGSLTFPCGPCNLPSRLETDHRGWRLGLNATTEVNAGPFVFIPSLEILGGATRTQQTYAQQRHPIPVGGISYYNSNTNVRWQDIGAKFGLGISVPVGSMIEFGIGGTLAVVYRNANLRGDDAFEEGGLVQTSVIDVSRSTAALIPGAQAQVTMRPLPNVQLRAFGGIERDSRVPGIAAPTFTADQFFAFVGGSTNPATPANINFSSQTSYFVGGGVTVAFAP